MACIVEFAEQSPYIYLLVPPTKWPDFINCLYPMWFETRLKKASVGAK